MIDYLIRSGVCLTVLLAVYHLFLAKEQMYRFNRLFLLFSMVFGLLIPLVSLTITPAPLQAAKVPSFEQVFEVIVQRAPAAQAVKTNREAVDTSQQDSQTAVIGYKAIISWIYMLAAAALFARFVRNVFKVATKIRRHRRVAWGSITIVLLHGRVVPHSFLNYIFLSERAYSPHSLEEQIVVHELAHVKQKHSIDVLLAELLKIVFWFNPIFILYKKAIQLNHEFLADESVIALHPNVHEYQLLLLESVGVTAPGIACSFNYSLTKTRLKMMKKHTSRSRAILLGAALAPVVAALAMLFSNQNQVVARQQAASAVKKKLPAGDGSISKEDYYKGATIWMKNSDGKYEAEKYDEMTAAEKAAVPRVPPVRFGGLNVYRKQTPKGKGGKLYSELTLTERNAGLTVKAPTKELMDSWMEAPADRIFLDLKAIKAVDLANYKPDDFAVYSAGTHRTPPNTPANRTDKAIKTTYLWLYTRTYFNETVVKPRYKPGKELTVVDDYYMINMHVGRPEPLTPGEIGKAVLAAP